MGRVYILLSIFFLAVSAQETAFDFCSGEICHNAVPRPPSPGQMTTDQQQDRVFELFEKNLDICKNECIAKWKDGGVEANEELIENLSKLEYASVNSRRLK